MPLGLSNNIVLSSSVVFLDVLSNLGGVVKDVGDLILHGMR